MQTRLLLSLLLLTGCPPTLGLDDDDTVGDDDDTVGDDDDTVGDDDDTWGDDDDSWGDDDDDVIVECTWEWGNIGLSSSEGVDYEGTWYEGEVNFQPEGVVVTDASGAEILFNSSYSQVLDGLLPGPGRVFWWNGGNSAWGTDGVLAIEMWGPQWTRTLLANEASVPDELANEWQLWVEPDRFGCENAVVETKCGAASPMPIWFELVRMDGQFESEWMQPGQSWSSADGLSWLSYLGGIYNWEVFCPDTPEMEWAWVYSETIDGPILGGGPDGAP